MGPLSLLTSSFCHLPDLCLLHSLYLYLCHLLPHLCLLHSLCYFLSLSFMTYLPLIVPPSALFLVFIMIFPIFWLPRSIHLEVRWSQDSFV